MAAEAEAIDEGEPRELYLDRRVVSLRPGRIDIKPARSIIFLPLLTLVLGAAAFPVIYFWGGDLSIELRVLLTLAAVIVVPLSGVGLVYSIAGAHIVVDSAKQSLVLQQGYLGMGVGTLELVPFWKIDRLRVLELTPHDARGHQDDFAQFEISVLKLSGKVISVGLVTVARAEAEQGLERAREVAQAISELTGCPLSLLETDEEDGLAAGG